MITLEYCAGFSGLTGEEALTIAEAEHASEILTCGVAQYLSQELGRYDLVRDLIVKDVRCAQGEGRGRGVQELLHVLKHFLRSHPEARPAVHPSSSIM